MAEKTLKVKDTVTDQKDMKTHGIVKKLKVGIGNQMDKDKKFHVVIQQLLDKYGEFSWEKHWREKERRMERDWGGKWKAVGEDDHMRTMTKIKDGDKDD